MLNYHLKLKTAISRFVFQIFHVNKLWWFVSSNWISSLVKNKSVKLSFVTKNSKHLVGTSGDDLSALIEFTPLWKTKVSNYPLYLKREIWLAVYSNPIWLVWHTYISHLLTHSLTHSLTHWPIDPSITYPTRRLRGIFYKKITKKSFLNPSGTP